MMSHERRFSPFLSSLSLANLGGHPLEHADWNHSTTISPILQKEGLQLGLADTKIEVTQLRTVEKTIKGTETPSSVFFIALLWL